MARLSRRAGLILLSQWAGGLVLLASGPARSATASARKAAAGPATRKAAKAAAAGAGGTTGTYAGSTEAMALAQAIAERRSLDPAWARQIVGEARRLPQVARWVLPSPSPTAKNWRAYRERFIDPIRIHGGLAFWRKHRATLERAQERHGVPASIIVAIIGIETLYGRQMGDFRVLDALATLSLDFPSEHPRAAERQAFFRGELETLLVLAAEGRTDARTLRGSYAGAIGLPQFMPSSWARLAVDFDDDGRIDLVRSAPDAIGSVANFLQAHGWQAGMPTHFEARFDPARLKLDELLAPDILPTFSAERLGELGLELGPDAAAHKGKMALVELRNGADAPSYVIGTENFYVVTRYNWSSYYALAVIELARELAAAL